MPQVGQSQEANKAYQIAAEAELEMDEALMKAANEIMDRDMDKYGYVKEGVEKRAYQQIEPDLEDILRKSSYKQRENYENEQGAVKLVKMVNKKVPSGTPFTPKMFKIMKNKLNLPNDKIIERAVQLGYDVPTKREFERWQ
jgi:hypothetical protein